jgi:uncharacterized protein YecT (DUF1311 family)
MKLTSTVVLAALLAAGAAQAQLKIPGPPASPDASAPAPGGAQAGPQSRPNVVPPNMPDPYTKEFRACAQKSQELMRGKGPDDTGVILAWKSCFEAETVRQDAKITSSLQRLAGLMQADEKKRLDLANADWRRFRNSECAFSFNPKGKPQDTAMNAQCIFQQTTERAHELEGYSQVLADREAQKKAAAAAPPPAPSAPAPADAAKK